MSEYQPQTAERRHVRVWFGQHVIASYTAEPALAAQYATAMGRRFAGLKVTTDPVPLAAASAEPLPARRLWDVTPH